MPVLAPVVIVGLLALVAGTTLTLARAIRKLGSPRSNPRPRELPPLLVIRPVRGHDAGLDANLKAALTQHYPGPMETLFVVDDGREPAVPIIERAIRAHGGAARIVFAGPLRGRRTGKLHAMIRGLEAARLRTDLVCFADSDTRPAPTLLRDLTEAVISSRENGAAFARGVCTEPPETPWDVGHSLMLDALYGPQAALAMRRDGSLPFIMGQTMVLRRAALAAAGGLEASTGQLVDDMHIGKRIAAAGYHNLLCSQPVPLIQAGLTWREFSSLAVRWITYSRTGIPFWPFNAPTIVYALAFFTGVIGALYHLASLELPIAAGFAACAGSAVIAIDYLRRAHGAGRTPRRFFWAGAVFLALLPVFFLRARLAKTVVWRGRSYSLDRDGYLDPRPAPVT